MIVYNLICSAGHGFEAWFKDSKAFASQRRARKIACPVCGDAHVDKVPSAPRIAKGAARSGDAAARSQARSAGAYAMLAELHRHVRENCEDVGPRFAEEARKIHYGEAEARGIHGEATADEAESLAEEGVPFAALPKLPEKDA